MKTVSRVAWLRLFNRVLPLNHRYYPLARSLAISGGDLLIPSLGLNIVVPTGLIEHAMPVILGGLPAVVPDFVLVQDTISRLADGCIIDVGANAGS